VGPGRPSPEAEARSDYGDGPLGLSAVALAKVEEPAPPHPLLSLLAREDGVTLDELLGETGRNSSDLLGELLDLELAGLVCRDPAGRFLPSERKW
jgi:predicted Rossmann fold nucleotide-binding protein DprA/Smf involved in DNA uptake